MIQLNQNIQDLQKFNVTVKELPSLLKDLHVGQIIRSRIVDVLDKNEVLLLINGQKFLAQTNLNLDIDDILFLKVQSLKPNIILQFYGIESSSSKDPGSEILRMFNLDKDIINKIIVSSLIKYNIPVSKNEIQNILDNFNSILLKIAKIEKGIEKDPEISKALNTLKMLNIPIEDENLVNSISFLRANNIPVTPLTVAKSLIFSAEKQDIGLMMTQLLNLIKENQQIPKELFDRLNILANDKNNFEQIFSNIGLDYEKRISDLLKGKKKEELEIKNTLKGTLLDIEKIILENPRMENSEKLLVLAKKILNNIEVQQLLNNDETSINRNWIFQIPVPFGGAFKTVELKINKRKDGSGNYKNSTTSFNLRVEMSKLGDVYASGNLYNNNLSCFFGLEKNEFCELFESEFESLKKHLQDMGYSIGTIQADIASAANPEFVDNFNKSQNLTAIDFKV